MSKNYKDAMNKITVDEQMKKRILNNINSKKEIKFKKKDLKQSIKNYSYKYYKNFAMIAACCAIAIFSVNNKELFSFLNFKDNHDPNTEIVFNEPQEHDEANNNQDLQPRERIDSDLKSDCENSSAETANNSKKSKSVGYGNLNNSIVNNNSNNNNSENRNSNNVSESNYYKTNDNAQNTDKENNSNTNEQSNDGIKENNNTKQESSNADLGIQIAQASGTIKERYDLKIKTLDKQFNNLEDLKNDIDFNIKTPKVESGSNEIKMITMDSNERILIDYENKNYSLAFKIEKVTKKKENLDNTKYETEKLIKINEHDVLLKGNRNLINNASWIEDDISFTIEPLSEIKEEQIIEIIKSVE